MKQMHAGGQKEAESTGGIFIAATVRLTQKTPLTQLKRDKNMCVSLSVLRDLAAHSTAKSWTEVVQPELPPPSYCMYPTH